MSPRCNCGVIGKAPDPKGWRWQHAVSCPAYTSVLPPVASELEMELANDGWIARDGGWAYPDLDTGIAMPIEEALTISRGWRAHDHARAELERAGAAPAERPRMRWRPILVAALFTIVLALAAAFILVSMYEGSGYAASKCRTVPACHRALEWQRHDRGKLRERLLHRDRVDLHRAIAISADLFGVSEKAMTCVAWAESGYGAQTTPEPSSGALGPFQWLSSSWNTTPLGRAGYARTDFLAASLSTAQRVVIDHGWREWVTGPGCGL